MTKVITYGSFDLFHYGHYELLRRARALGDYLVVGLSTDEFGAAKGKRHVLSFEKRKEMLESLRFVDEVIPEDSWEQKFSDVDEHGIKKFVMGSDWQGKFDLLKHVCEVVYLERTPEISTTKIKKALE